jgi:putative DNA primase/helicase
MVTAMRTAALTSIVAESGASAASSLRRPVRTERIDAYDLTELGNARRLVDRHGEDLRYAEGRGWIAWDGQRWRPGAKGHVIRKAKDIVRQMKREATKLEDVDEATRLFKWAIRSQSRYAIDAVVALAWSEPEIETALGALDPDPLLFNVLNGTLDLRTGQLYPHRREDLITKLAPVEYDPAAKSERLDRFLDETTGGNSELCSYMQRALGYSLTGDTSEEVIFFGHGPAASGKSTFMSMIKNAMGDYAMTADFDTFLAKRFGGGIRNDVARLAGARLVSSIEVEEGKRLAEGMVKELTGGDTVSARFLYKEHFEFKPGFKLWLIANHKPRVRDDDDAIWRRIRVIPFSHPVPKERRDPAVKAELTDVSRSGAAILAWMVGGYAEWQRVGLGLPKGVEDATAEYREEMDFSARFWEERCLFEPSKWTATADLR